MTVVVPAWDVKGVRAVVTTVAEGNLALHAGETERVSENRAQLVARQGLPAEPVWMSQVHGIDVLEVDRRPALVQNADAAYTRREGLPLVVMVADCLPILVADIHGEEIAVVHAGWRGLADGIIGSAVSRFKSRDLVAWIGPGIGPCHYEVDEVVRNRFGTGTGFVNGRDDAHWMMDLPLIAQQQLTGSGVQEVHRCEICTVCDDRFFSHRQDSGSGRFAAVIWRQAQA